jgi:hypothetical protein
LTSDDEIPMKKRTTEDIDIEIEEIELESLDLKKSIHEDEPDWREPLRRKTGDIGIGYVPLAERRERIKLLDGKVSRLKKERSVLSAMQSQSTGKKFGYGALKQKVQLLVKRDGCKTGDTVPSTIIAKWRTEIEKEGYKTSDAAIRAALSQLGTTKERVKKK